MLNLTTSGFVSPADIKALSTAP